jgi:hypothetical protein
MKNIIKYEWKKSWRTYVTGIAIVFLLYIYILARINFLDFQKLQQQHYFGPLESFLNVAPVVTYMGILFIGTIVLIIHGITHMYDDLYKESSYLLYSIPKTGYEIVGSKLILSVLRMGAWVILMFFTATHLISTAMSKSPYDINIISILGDNVHILLLIFISMLFMFAFFLITIYFCFVLNKTVFSDIKYRTLLSLVTFFVLLYVINKINYFISSTFTWTVNIPLNITKIKAIADQSIPNLHMNMNSAQNGLNIDIIPDIVHLVIFGALFVYTSILVERKLNL